MRSYKGKSRYFWEWREFRNCKGYDLFLHYKGWPIAITVASVFYNQHEDYWEWESWSSSDSGLCCKKQEAFRQVELSLKKLYGRKK